MKARGISTVTILVTLILLLSLTGCQTMGRYQQDSYQETDFNTGTEGITVSLLEQAPPRSIYEDSEFDVHAQIHNEGSFDLDERNYSMSMMLKYDSSSVRMLQGSQSNRYMQLDALNVYGKSQMFPEGETVDLPIGSFEPRNLRANFETDTSRFVLSYCYPYRTVFSQSVCVDTDAQGTDARQQVCSARDHAYSEGQGGPVGVEAIETQMIPVGDYVKPQFTLQLRRYGDGYVSAFNLKSDGEGGGTCGDINESTINTVNVNAYLGEEQLTCRPLNVQFEDGREEVQCQLDNSDILGVKSSYYTELHVEMEYLYSDKTSKEVLIQRSGDPVFYSQQEPGEEKCLPWEERHDGQCISKCAYYAKNHDYDEFEKISQELTRASTPWSIEYSPLAYLDKKSKQEQDVVYDSMACMYDDMTECRKADGKCIPAQGLCFPETYCGWPTCVDSNKRPWAQSVRQEGDTITWQCYDPDSSKDIERTCGCTDTAYYTFVDYDALDSATYCKNLPRDRFKEIEGRFSDVHGMTYEVPIDAAQPEEDRLCILVEDKLGAQSIKSFSFTRRN